MPKDAGGRCLKRDIAFGTAGLGLDVYGPEPRPAAAAALVVFIHGGGWDSGRKEDYDFVGTAFASRGFVTVVPDYRLVPAVRFPAFLADCAEAVRWAQDHGADYGGRPDRIFLVGHSAGAYDVVMLALDRRFLAAAGVPADHLKGVAGLAGPYDFLPLNVASTSAAFGMAADLARTQPINLVAAGAPPMLLANGQADDVVRPKNSRVLAGLMRDRGNRVVEKYYPDLGHVGILLALGRPFRARAPVLDDVVGFFNSLPG